MDGTSQHSMDGLKRRPSSLEAYFVNVMVVHDQTGGIDGGGPFDFPVSQVELLIAANLDSMDAIKKQIQSNSTKE